MLNINSFNSDETLKALNYGDFEAVTSSVDEDASIFDFGVDDAGITEESISELNAKLDSVEDKQGVFLNGWNNFKEKVGVGTSAAKCDEAIEKYKNGEITFEEASAEIDKFAAKQDSSLNLFSNIATSVAAIGAVAIVTAATGGAALPVLAAVGIGAATGAATKAGYKLTDRATNQVEGDALDAKQIVQDGLSGAVTGGIAVATAGTGETAFKAAGEGAKFSTHVAKGAVSSAKTGIKTGAISGSSNYLIDCAFDEDKKFDMSEFAETTATSTLVGGTVGVIMGGTNGALRHSHILNASNSDVLANSASTTAYKVTNDRIRSVAA